MLIGFTGKSRITGVFPKTILLIIGKIINDQTPTYSETDENCYSAHLIILLYPRMKWMKCNLPMYHREDQWEWQWGYWFAEADEAGRMQECWSRRGCIRILLGSWRSQYPPVWIPWLAKLRPAWHVTQHMKVWSFRHCQLPCLISCCLTNIWYSKESRNSIMI